jgi:hypothetical protein
MNLSKLKMAIIFAFMIGGVLASCKKDDVTPEPEPEPEIPTAEIANAGLKAALERKGFIFDDGKLVLNDSVLNLTVLDVAGCELSDASGLNVFPKLEEVNFADNNFFYSFDFSVLPASVVRVNLSGNEIYEFPGLVNVVIEENEDETVTLLRQLTKIYLPHSAKYNCKEIVYLYEQLKTKIDNGEAEMKMDNADGHAVVYNTLREVPNEVTRAMLQTLFPLFFEGDSIDIGKRVIDASARTKAIISDRNSTNVEGAQYILHHRDFKGASAGLQVNVGDEHTVMPYLKIPPHLDLLIMLYVDTPNGIDCSEAENLYRIYVYNNSELKTLDLSASKTLGQRDVTVEYHASTNSTVSLGACTALQEIIFPEAATGLSSFELFDLPALKSLDLRQMGITQSIALTLLPETCTITMPEIRNWIKRSTPPSIDENGTAKLAVRRDIAHRTAVTNFIRTYRSHLTASTAKAPSGSRITDNSSSEEKNYSWANDAELN